MTGFVLVFVFCLWIIAIGWLANLAMDRQSIWLGVAAIAVCSLIGVLLPVSPRDPHASDLCLHGHEEWVRVYHPTAVVGKLIVPARTATEKRWVCEQWSPR